MAAQNDLTEYEKEERAQAAHKREMEKIAAQERVARVEADAIVGKAKAENRPISVSVICALFVLLAVIGGLTYGCTRPPTPGEPTDLSRSQVEQKREEACIGEGGGWVPKSLTTGQSEGICVFPGGTVNE